MATPRALIIGGTRGIGEALAHVLSVEKGWTVTATSRQDFDISLPETWNAWREELEKDTKFGLVVFSAGQLKPEEWSEKTLSDYQKSYAIHCAGPLAFLAEMRDLIPWSSQIVFLSTVGAKNVGIIDLAYGCAKAALEKAARALAFHEIWVVTLVRLDLVETQMLKDIPRETLEGRKMLGPFAAAYQIVEKAGI